MKKILIPILFFVGSLVVSAQETKSLNPDGPYIFYENNGLKIVSVTEEGKVQQVFYKDIPANFTFSVLSEDVKHQFEVALHPVARPTWNDRQPEKVFITSDPHGNIDCFVSILKARKIMDDHYHWNFGKNHLVIIGDVFDRGNDVVPIFWLIYKLEQEAAEAGGKVSYLLGNHEEMVLRGNLKYVKEKYIKLSEELGTPYNTLWNENSELGHWLRTRNTVQVIGKNLFVHAGLSPQFLEKHLSIPAVNDTVSKYLSHTKEEREQSPLAAFLFGNNGPLWYRGMVRTDRQYNPMPVTILNFLLKAYNVERIYVGHTIFTDILGFYKDRVIDVNVDNKENMEAQRARAILIDKEKIYLIYDSGDVLERYGKSSDR